MSTTRQWKDPAESKNTQTGSKDGPVAPTYKMADLFGKLQVKNALKRSDSVWQTPRENRERRTYRHENQAT